ncbi:MULTISPECIES: ATP-binding cassette domain-containing protein [Streptomyces]|uniref:ATP-binding cassette domain-containing protein n=1 Tax=Streptomyces TaxID=1883 RepID=UPI0004C66F99|nr:MULTISPECIES: ATP-binding cassette domain-containing protein [unclassified Streptomyces]QRI43523.1 ABC transporter ATP-binding protein [Streptomyces sp. NRRL S-4]
MRAVLARFLQISGRKKLASLCLFLLLGAVVQGVAFTFVVPITTGLLTPGAAAPWGWIAALAAVSLVYAVLHHRSVPLGNELGAELVTTLHRKVAEHTATLPNRTLGVGRSDRLAALDGTAVVVLMGLPAHVMRPVVAAVATPLTVIVISAFVNLQMALTLAAGLIVLALCSFLVVRLLSRSEEPDGSEWLRRSYEQRGAGRQGGFLPTATGEVLLWRAVELAACAAVGACGAAVSADGLSGTRGVALIVLSVLTYRPMMEAVLLTSTVMNAHEVMATIGRLLDIGDSGSQEVRPGADWPDSTDLVFDGVSVRVEGTTVLDTVSFEIPGGTTTALVGTPDGTRLLLGDLLTGDVAPTSGQVRIGGVDVTSLAPSVVERHIARVRPQDPRYTREEAGRLVASFPDRLTDRPGVQDGLDRLRAAVVVEDTASEPLTESRTEPLSSEDRWRLALLCALSGDPSLVVVDATAGTDPFEADPRLAELFTGLSRDRTCWFLTGIGGELPPCERLVEVSGSRATARIAVPS